MQNREVVAFRLSVFPYEYFVFQITIQIYIKFGSGGLQ
jgi:hypothetical protein